MAEQQPNASTTTGTRPPLQAGLQRELVARLLAEQRADGAWGALAGRNADVEATAFAIMGLSAAATGNIGASRHAEHRLATVDVDPAALARAFARAVAWLVSTQSRDGSWALRPGGETGAVPETTGEPRRGVAPTVQSGIPRTGQPAIQPSPWATAEAVLALADHPEAHASARAGARWLLAEKGEGARFLTRVLYRWFPETLATELNPQILAWPWVPGTASWVEPTSFALLALKRMRGDLDPTRAAARIGDGEAMLYDRMCYGGGWNYGNRRVYHVDILPYPDTTALALIALQDRGDDANRASLAKLRELAAATPTGLSLALTMICLSLYGQDPAYIARLAEALARSYRNTAFLGETRLAGLALMALAGRGHALEVTA